MHKKKTDGTIFYIGIGNKATRAYSKHGRNFLWKNIVNKHGFEVVIVMEDVSASEAKYCEKYLIAYHGRKNTGLGNLCNMTDGGDGFTGVVYTEERRRKIGLMTKGKKLSEEVKKKISQSHIGKKHTEASKIKMRLAKIGISPANKGKKTGIPAPNAKSVLFYNSDGSIIKEFNNTYEAADFINCSQSTVFKGCKFLIKMKDGRYFRYKKP